MSLRNKSSVELVKRGCNTIFGDFILPSRDYLLVAIGLYGRCAFMGAGNTGRIAPNIPSPSGKWTHKWGGTHYK
ncbi:MAG: hypothetical protein WCX63_03340 [Methanoregula sp.]